MSQSSKTGSQPSDLELAALVSSRICHDIINPVGAIMNGLEMLDEDDDPKARDYALHVIRNVTEQASARLKFARLAYGANQSAGDSVDVKMAQEAAHDVLASQPKSKHALVWRMPPGFMGKDHAKLLLNLVTLAVTALPKGGEIEIVATGDLAAPKLTLRCRGADARPPQYLGELIAPGAPPQVTSLNVQAYYTVRIARSVGMLVEILREGADIVLSARAG
jgi:histidine phosphotransferase ChpT